MKKKEVGNLFLARRIRAAGCSIPIAEDDGEPRYIPSHGLRVYQTGGVIESTAFDWGLGTGIKINLIITSNISMFAISHFELKLPWEHDYIQWLEDPLVIDGPSKQYRFCGNDVLEFERNLVINHRLDVTRPFASGESAKGFLLGLGYDSIPAEFAHGAMIPAFLVIWDQHGRESQYPIKLWADRSQKNLRRPRSRRKGGLLDKRDTIVRG
jgi:hypothetical protein